MSLLVCCPDSENSQTQTENVIYYLCESKEKLNIGGYKKMRKLTIKNTKGNNVTKGGKVRVISRTECKISIRHYGDDDDCWCDDTVLGD